uniref:Protein CLEC16A n=1 Tax=Cacopsylla melanoneura TaxID=428564 RepID=A0A8D8M0U4_9HEMI
MFRSRSWFWSKPKNIHSLEHLKYLYNVLNKNQTVTESNRGLLVETLRSIAEILIWGDQNDSSVFEFFLEKNMLSFFLNILKQKCGSYVCVQLLQTLNILFENLRNKTSLYFLLSNNHVNNNIIVHKFDFSDEEVMAYYISFLKTLSLKINTDTIHFFYNENDFPLYTEAIKFFNHPESMVRIAVRTLSLNVYRVDDKSMIQFIRNRTAAPYFSNLVWFIGNHVLELDSCVRNEANHNNENRLSDLVAEHLDHLHYLNDILTLNIEALNQVLTHHLLNKLLIPLYIYSLIPNRNKLSSSSTDSPQSEDYSPPMQRSRISSVVSLFLLSQVFLILSHEPLIHTLAHIILKGSANIYRRPPSLDNNLADQNSSTASSSSTMPGFVPPKHTLEESLCPDTERREGEEEEEGEEYDLDLNLDLNITDEEKEQRLAHHSEGDAAPGIFLETIVSTLICLDNDYTALFSLCLLYAVAINKGVGSELTQSILSPAVSINPDKSHAVNPNTPSGYNSLLVDKLINIITLSCQPGCRVRLVTLEVTILLLKKLVLRDQQSILSDAHLAAIVNAKEESTSLLRAFYKEDDIFLDMFQFEYEQIQKKPLNVEYLMMDSKMLLPPAGTPLTGIEFTKRLPCGHEERAKRAIRVFLLIRELCLLLAGEIENQLPLTNYDECAKVDSVLDLTNSDLLACTVVKTGGGPRLKQFLVINESQVILVEPAENRLGWGVTKLAAFLQDMEVAADREDSKCLHITMHRTNSLPLHQAKFIFDDHIRCLAAKQRLDKGRKQARLVKMIQLAKLLDLPVSAQPCPSPPQYNFRVPRAHPSLASRSRPLFTCVPGYATPVCQFTPRDRSPHSRPGSASGRDSVSPQTLDAFGSHLRDSSRHAELVSAAAGLRSHSSRSPHGSKDPHRSKSRDSSGGSRTRKSLSVPSGASSRPSSEEIPLNDINARLGHLPSPSSSQTSGGVTNDPSSAGSNILGTGSSLSRKSSGASSAGSREDSGNSLLSSGVATGSSMGIPNHQPLTRRKKNRGQIETV